MSASSSADANICYVEQTIDADSDTHFSQNEFMDGIDDSVEPIEATSTPCHISGAFIISIKSILIIFI